MKPLTKEQHAALRAARRIVASGRAQEIRRLKHWEHGLCLCLNADKPDVSPVTPSEDRAIKALWDTLPGWTCWMTALELLCQEQPITTEA